MKSSFVLFPNDLKAEHDRVNDMSQKETSKAYDRRSAKFRQPHKKIMCPKCGHITLPLMFGEPPGRCCSGNALENLNKIAL